MKKQNAFSFPPVKPSARKCARLKCLAAKVKTASDALNAGDTELNRHRLQRDALAEKITTIEDSPNAVAESARLPALREEQYFHERRITEMEEKLKADPRMKSLQAPLNELGQAFSQAMRAWLDQVECDWSATLAPLFHGNAEEARQALITGKFPVYKFLSASAVVNPRRWGMDAPGCLLTADYALHLVGQVLAGRNPWLGFFSNPNSVAR